MQKNNFLIPAIMLLTVFSAQSLDNTIKLSAINFGTGFVVGAAQGGLNRIHYSQMSQIPHNAVEVVTAGYAHIIRHALVQHDPTLGKESEQNQIFLSMAGQGLGQFVAEGIHIEKDILGEDVLKFKFSVNISLLLPLIYRAVCESKVLYETYRDRLWDKKN